MNEIQSQIIKQLEKHNNNLLFNEELYEHHKKLSKTYNTIYISTPKKGKRSFEQILKKLNPKTYTKNKTIIKIFEEITENVKYERIYIC